MLAEVGVADTPWTSELADVVKHCQRQKQGMRMIIWGATEAIQKVHQFLLSEMMTVGGPLQGYKTRLLYLFMSKDDPLPYRAGYSGNVTRSVLLLSPSGFKKGMDYMVTQGTWTPSIIVHLIGLLDIIRGNLIACLSFVTIGCIPPKLVRTGVNVVFTIF